MQLVTRSLRTYGRYCIGLHELTAGDTIEFADDDRVVPGRIEHDGLRYIVVCGDRRLPLVEIVQARYVGRGTL